MLLQILVILLLRGTFLTAPTVLNQVRCEQKGYLFIGMFSWVLSSATGWTH